MRSRIGHMLDVLEEAEVGKKKFSSRAVAEGYRKIVADMLEPEIQALEADAWDKGFSAHVNETRNQEQDPNHPITRDNPFLGEL